MRARLATGEIRKILGALLRSRDADLALIRAEAGTYPPLPLGTDVEVKEGMPVVNIGNPMGLSFTVSEGIVSALRPNGVPEDLRGTEDEPAQKQPLIQISAFSAGGASGSPVLSANGKVIGVIRSGIGAQSSFTFAVPAAALAKLVATVEPGATPKPFRSFPMKGLVISAVVYGALMAGWLVMRWRKRRQPEPAPVATNRQYRR
jgi:S1-C subfamily serine protease